MPVRSCSSRRRSGSAWRSPPAPWSRALGAGESYLARQKTATSLGFGIVFGIVFAAVVWVNLGLFVSLLGAEGRTHALAVGYLQIVVPGLPFLLAGMVGSAILRAHGDARRAMMATIWGGVVNAVLDPILIFGLDLELTGAALASLAARVTIAAAALVPIWRHYGGVARPSPQALREDLVPLLGIAFPAILTKLATPVGQAYVTRAMADFGEAAVAGMAIIGRLTPVAFGVLFALSGAIGPIIGQNYGAGEYGRVRRAYLDSLIFIAIFVLGVSLLMFLLRPAIAWLFSAEGVTKELLFLFCGPLALMWAFNGVIFTTNAAFNNLGRPFVSNMINWGRHTVGTVPLVMVGGYWYGAKGVLIGQAVGGMIFALIAVVILRGVMANPGPRGTPAPFLGHRRVLQLFHARR